MGDTRAKDVSWGVADPKTGVVPTWERVGVAVLMDIRDELKRLNGLLSCPNFTGIPSTLRRISRNTAKPKKRAKS